MTKTAQGVVMKLFGRNSIVKVEFVNVETGKTFAISDMPPESLPETFAVKTTMHIRDEDWEVVSAEPPQASEFRKTGKLRLVLRKVVWMDPRNILFTIPSICNFIGDASPGFSRTGKELEIHEDNWRNIEMISLAFESDINTYLNEILRIHHEERQGLGFKRMFIREGIEFPLASVTILLKEIENSFPGAKKYSGLSYKGSKGVVARSFAFKTEGGLTLYGRQQSGMIQELCVANCEPNERLEQDINVLKIIMADYHLCFVDWCRVVKEVAGNGELFSYFSQVYREK
jgi:hypothetical protein